MYLLQLYFRGNLGEVIRFIYHHPSSPIMSSSTAFVLLPILLLRLRNIISDYSFTLQVICPPLSVISAKGSSTQTILTFVSHHADTSYWNHA